MDLTGSVKFFHLSVPAAQAKLVGLFTSFSKWETYGAAFKMVDAGEATLEDVQDAASEFAGIKPSVVAMRRRNFIFCFSNSSQTP
jgi:hypothetical protein